MEPAQVAAKLQELVETGDAIFAADPSTGHTYDMKAVVVWNLSLSFSLCAVAKVLEYSSSICTFLALCVLLLPLIVVIITIIIIIVIVVFLSDLRLRPFISLISQTLRDALMRPARLLADPAHLQLERLALRLVVRRVQAAGGGSGERRRVRKGKQMRETTHDTTYIFATSWIASRHVFFVISSRSMSVFATRAPLPIAQPK
jgi:hypothetical protein